jgi:hypothetical protein
MSVACAPAGYDRRAQARRLGGNSVDEMHGGLITCLCMYMYVCVVTQVSGVLHGVLRAKERSIMDEGSDRHVNLPLLAVGIDS